MELLISNTGTQPMEFTSALHTYFASPDYRLGALSGLEGLEYWDNGFRLVWAQRTNQRRAAYRRCLGQGVFSGQSATDMAGYGAHTAD